MDKADVLQAIEDLLDSSDIPMKEYRTHLFRDNGDCWLEICRKEKDCRLPHMFQFSEIINSYTEDWSVYYEDSKLHIRVI